MLEIYLKNILPGHAVELLAALGGTFYLFKVPGVKPSLRIFVYFLWLIFFVELLGLYSLYNYFYEYKYLEFIKGTSYEQNYWLYNSFHVISYMVYFYFFIQQLESKKVSKHLISLAWFFFASSIAFLIFSGVFFVNFSFYTIITGTIILILCIGAYYYEMLKSDGILKFNQSPTFYISVGALIWHVVVTPLLIYGRYYSTTSPEFIKMYSLILGAANLFLYGIYLFGFIICSQRKYRNIRREV